MSEAKLQSLLLEGGYASALRFARVDLIVKSSRACASIGNWLANQTN